MESRADYDEDENLFLLFLCLFCYLQDAARSIDTSLLLPGRVRRCWHTPMYSDHKMALVLISILASLTSSVPWFPVVSCEKEFSCFERVVQLTSAQPSHAGNGDRTLRQPVLDCCTLRLSRHQYQPIKR